MNGPHATGQGGGKPLLVACIGAILTLTAWKFLPGYTRMIATLYVAISLGYLVWDGWGPWRAVLTGGIVVGLGLALSLALQPHARHDQPQEADTADLAPPGTTVSCERDPGAAWANCQTYPPGDNGWTFNPPAPPQRPLPTPWPGGEDAR